MFKIYTNNGGRFQRTLFFIFGWIMIVLGVLIIAFPKIFAYGVAGLLILLGLVLLVSGLKMKNRTNNPPQQYRQQGDTTEEASYEEIRD